MKRLFTAMAVSVLLLSGCSNTVDPGDILEETAINEEGPDDFAGDEVAGLNWFEANRDAYELFTEEMDDSLYSKDFTAEFNESTKVITLLSIVNDAVTPEEALDYATEVLNRFNDQIMFIQDESLEISSNTSYGGIYKEYNVKIQVTTENNLNDESKFFVNTEIPAGSEYKDLELQK